MLLGAPVASGSVPDASSLLTASTSPIVHANLSLLNGLYWSGFSPMCFRSIWVSGMLVARRAVLVFVYVCTCFSLSVRSRRDPCERILYADVQSA